MRNATSDSGPRDTAVPWPSKGPKGRSEAITNSWHISKDEVITILTVLQAQIFRRHCQILWILIPLWSSNYSSIPHQSAGPQDGFCWDCSILSLSMFYSVGLQRRFEHVVLEDRMLFNPSITSGHVITKITASSTWTHFLHLRTIPPKRRCQPHQHTASNSRRQPFTYF
jgi:hypothetical protein